MVGYVTRRVAVAALVTALLAGCATTSRAPRTGSEFRGSERQELIKRRDALPTVKRARAQAAAAHEHAVMAVATQVGFLRGLSPDDRARFWAASTASKSFEASAGIPIVEEIPDVVPPLSEGNQALLDRILRLSGDDEDVAEGVQDMYYKSDNGIERISILRWGFSSLGFRVAGAFTNAVKEYRSVLEMYAGSNKVERVFNASEIEASAQRSENLARRRADNYKLYLQRVAAARQAVGEARSKEK